MYSNPLDHKQGSRGKQMNKDQRKSLKSSEAFSKQPLYQQPRTLELFSPLGCVPMDLHVGLKNQVCQASAHVFQYFSPMFSELHGWWCDAGVITNHQPLWLKGKHPEFALYWLYKNHIVSHWK